MDAETCHRCGRRTAFRFWSWRDGEKRLSDGRAACVTKIAFCTFFCARMHHDVTGHAVVDETDAVVIQPRDLTQPRVQEAEDRAWIKALVKSFWEQERERETPGQAKLRKDSVFTQQGPERPATEATSGAP